MNLFGLSSDRSFNFVVKPDQARITLLDWETMTDIAMKELKRIFQEKE